MMKKDNLYDSICAELWEKHSLSALLFLLNTGRELNFIYEGKQCGIFRHEKRWILSGEPVGNQEFDTALELISYSNFNGKEFFEVWDNIELKVLF